eukprot:15324659-Ditylum_brightwellii.AAC.1
MPDSEKKLSPLDYQTYKLWTNLKGHQGSGHPGWRCHVLLGKESTKGDALQVFQNKEASQKIKDGPAFTKCPASVTNYVFPKKAYKSQKKYI